MNPIWWVNNHINVEFDEVEDAPPIIISVWDNDDFSDNDLLGLAVVKMTNAD